MKRYVRFDVGKGDSIIVEVDEPAAAGATVPAGLRAEMPEKAKVTFEEALDRIRPIAEAVINRVRDLSDAPDEIGVEFGLKLSGTAGAIIASATMEANYKVTLTWRRSDQVGQQSPPAASGRRGGEH